MGARVLRCDFQAIRLGIILVTYMFHIILYTIAEYKDWSKKRTKKAKKKKKAKKTKRPKGHKEDKKKKSEKETKKIKKNCKEKKRGGKPKRK